MKYYAIKSGYDKELKREVKNQILTDWNIAKQYVTGINKKETGVSPEYKSFKKEQDALDYLNTVPYFKKDDGNYNMNCLHCYVDGSFSEELNNYSYGIVAKVDDKVLEMWSDSGFNTDTVSARQICGELTASMRSMLIAKKWNVDEVVILFDYKGVANHATGYWKRDTEVSKTYYEWCQKFFKNNPDIKVTFVKVDAHTGDDFNEIADGLAKKALQIKPNKVYFDMLAKYGLEDM